MSPKGSSPGPAAQRNPPTPEGSRRAGRCKKERMLGNRGLQERFTTSIRPGAEGVKYHTVRTEGPILVDRHGVFSHVGSGELPGVPGSSREVSGGALGAPEGSVWVQFQPSGKTLGPLLDNFLESFMSWECSERRNVLTFAKIHGGNVES